MRDAATLAPNPLTSVVTAFTDTDDGAAQPARRLITTHGEYLDALDTLLSLAHRAICIFDPDLGTPRLQQIARIECLRAFLAADRNNTLDIVLHDTSLVERDHARLIRLQQIFPEQVAFRRTDGEARRAEDCFVLIDARHFVRRPVAMQTRGVIALHEVREGRLLAERFDALVASSERTAMGTATGL